MNKRIILKNAEAFARAALSAEGTGHDWWHIERVRNNARSINAAEHGDIFVIELAVLLHDVGDRKVIKQAEDDHSIARKFLIDQKVPEAIIDSVMFIVEHMSFSKSIGATHTDLSKEFCVVQDADRLDAIGAIGIARAFAYGGSKGSLIYDPTKKARVAVSTDQYRKTNSSVVHHFEEKLFLLKDLMNTKTARRIAAKRHTYMQRFLTEFHAEWEGRA